MNDTSTHIREQAIALATSARSQVLVAARREIEALRLTMVTQLAALEQALAAEQPHPETDGALEQLCETAEVTLAITQAQLEGEIQQRQSTSAELKATAEKVQHATAEIEKLRAETRQAQSRVRALEQELSATRVAPSDVVSRVLEPLARALSSLAESTTGTDVLTTLVELFAQRFSRVVLCSVDTVGFTVWRSRGFDPPLDRKTVIRVTQDSLLMRAAAAWQPIAASTTTGVLGTPARYAIALPIVAKGRGTAMLYAENVPGAPVDVDDRVAGHIAEILAHYVKSRLQVKPTAAAAVEPTGHATQRQARRVKMLDGTTVVVDNVEGMLVDLSSLGAQVLSPRAISPNSAVRLVLDTDSGGVACAARVVWVIVEQQGDIPAPIYRAGVQFTEVQHGDLNGYLEFFDSAIRH